VAVLIAMQVGMANGSFYTYFYFYFGSKAEVFRTLVNGVMETGLCAPHAPATPRTNGRIPSVAEACSSQGRTPTTTSPPIGACESPVVNPRGRDERSSAAPSVGS
jgi:hypothetical protein